MMWSLSRKTAPVIDQNMTSRMAALTFDASDNNVWPQQSILAI